MPRLTRWMMHDVYDMEFSIHGEDGDDDWEDVYVPVLYMPQLTRWMVYDV